MRFNFKKTRDDQDASVSRMKLKLDAVLERSALLDDACGVGLWEAVLHDGDSMHPESRWTWSSELRRLLGYESEADFPNVVRSWSDKLHPDDAPAVFAAFAGHLEDRTGAARYDVTYRMQVRTGTYRWFRGSGGCRHHADGHTILACGSLTDVHDLVTLQQQAARDAEADNHAILALTKALAALAAGDLAHRVSETLSDKTTILKTDFNLAADNLQAIMQSVTNAVSALRGGAHEIGRSIEDLSNRTEMQAASLEETAAALDQLTSTVKKTAQGSRQVAAVTVDMRDEAKRSGELVETAVSAMTNIETSSRQISQIIGVIDDIAFQTNLLALNAAVEAARAGDAGKSFGVVAQEVRALAQRSADAAREIKALISVSTDQVARGVLLVGQTGETIGSIIDRFADIAGLVEGIAASTLEQSTGLGEVNTAVTQIDHMTQQNASMVEQTAAASQTLVNAANDLAELAARFRVEGAPVKRKSGQRAA